MWREINGWARTVEGISLGIWVSTLKPNVPEALHYLWIEFHVLYIQPDSDFSTQQSRIVMHLSTIGEVRIRVCCCETMVYLSEFFDFLCTFSCMLMPDRGGPIWHPTLPMFLSGDTGMQFSCCVIAPIVVEGSLIIWIMAWHLLKLFRVFSFSKWETF